MALEIMQLGAFSFLPGFQPNGEPDPLASSETLILSSTVLLGTVVLVGWISFAISAKRWHDRDKSGWYNLLVLVPFAGPIWFLTECGFLRGTVGPNRFGPDPLARG